MLRFTFSCLLLEQSYKKVADFLKDNAQRRTLYPAQQTGSGTLTPAPNINNVWGHGYAYLPTLTPTPTPTPTPNSASCLPVSNYAVVRWWRTGDYVSWRNPAGGLTVIRRSTEIWKRPGTAGAGWQMERIINEPPTSTYSYHLGIDAKATYAYKTRSVCSGGKNSPWTIWKFTYPVSRGASGDEGAPPQSTPVPWDYAVPSGGGEDPPSDLAAPTNVAATGGAGTVTVTWTDGRGALHHLVGLFTPDLKRRAAAKAVGSSHTFTGVAAGEYVAMVAAVGPDSNYLYTVSGTVTVR